MFPGLVSKSTAPRRVPNLRKDCPKASLIFTLGSVVLLFFCLHCQSLVSDSKMNAQGSQAFAQIKRKTLIEKSPRINRYVRCIAKAILSVTKDDTGVKGWEVVVFRDKAPNAFALPGGKIGVHTGILPIANSPGQLAAIMGHEVGHVIKRHGKKRYSQGVASQVGVGLVGIFAGGVAGRAAGAGVKYGVLLPFSRSHESEADIVGLELMSKAGFNPHESVKLWQNMHAASGGKAPPQFLSTHPSGKTRIRELQKHVPYAMLFYEQAQKVGRKPKCRL